MFAPRFPYLCTGLKFSIPVSNKELRLCFCNSLVWKTFNFFYLIIFFRAFQHIRDLETPECQVYHNPGQGKQPMLGTRLHVVSLMTLAYVFIAPLWKSGGYTGFALSLRHTVILWFSNSEVFSSHFSQELWGLEDWNLVHTWTVGSCIMCTGIRLLLIHSFISSFTDIKIFVAFFSGTVRPKISKFGTHNGQWADVSCIPESGCCCWFIPSCLHFSFSPIFKN